MTRLVGLTVGAVVALLLLPAELGVAGPPGSPDLLVELGDNSTGRALTADFEISPDGSMVVYRLIADTDDEGLAETPAREVYSVPIGGGTPTRLNAPILHDGDVERFEISPDSTTVVYMADQDTDQVRELYSVPIGGGEPTKLNAPFVAGGDIRYDFKISADSSIVVFIADADVNGLQELYSVPLGGGPMIKLNVPFLNGGDVIAGEYSISDDSRRVVYLADASEPGVGEVFSVPVGGGPSTKLNGPLVDGGAVKVGPVITADSQYVVYRADQDADQVFELYSVPISGGDPTKLSTAMVAGGDVGSADYRLSPDSKRVVYTADAVTNGMEEVFSVPIAGGASRKLSDSNPLRRSRPLIGISPDSRSVLYWSADTAAAPGEIYMAPTKGGTAERLGDGIVLDATFSPDSSRIFYVAKGMPKGTRDLFSVSAGGGPPVLLQTLPPGWRFSEVVPDSSLLLLDIPGSSLIALPVGGGPPVDLSGLIPGLSGTIRVSPDSEVVVFADHDGIYVVDLPPRCNGLIATIAGTGGADLLTGTTGDDVIAGLGGDDTIMGLGGADTICGGDGADTISGGPGADTLEGGPGDDAVRGGSGSDMIEGGHGDDILRGNRGRDTILAGPGDDLVFGNRGRDVLKGRSGNDRLFGGLSDDTLYGGLGDDRIRGYKGRDTIDGGPGTDNCRGGPHKDSIARCER